VIKKGFKEIMTLNLWSIDNKQDGSVVVSFVDDTRTYVIPISKIMSFEHMNVLKSFISFNRKDGCRLLNYQEKEFTYEEFDIIVKIYNREKLSGSPLTDTDHRIVDFFGFELKDILMQTFVAEFDVPQNVSANANPQLPTVSTGEFDVFDISPQAPTNQSGIQQDLGFTPDERVVLMGDPAKYEQALQTVKKHELPYMPFKVLMVEGMMSFGGGASGETPISLQMVPVYASFSENDNVMFLKHLVSLGFTMPDLEQADVDIENIFDTAVIDEDEHRDIGEEDNNTHVETNMSVMDNVTLQINDIDIIINDIDPIVNQAEDTDEDDDEEEDESQLMKSFTKIKDNENFYIVGYEADAKDVPSFRLKSCDTEGRINGAFLYLGMHASIGLDAMLKFMTSTDEYSLLATKQGDREIVKETDHWAIDKNGKLCILPKHFKAIHDQIKTVQLYQQVRVKMNQIQFKIPQRRSYVEHNFCNEQVYGNFNMLMVYGFMRMD
jgi:hypothetical protein